MHFVFFVLGEAALCARPLPAAAQLTAQSSHALAPALAQNAAAVPLTLEQAVAKALAANPGLRAAALDVAIADGARHQAGLLPNPELSFVREGTQRGTRTRTLQLSQVLELGGKRSARVKLADTERSLAAGQLELARTDLRADVSAAYFDALAAQERLELSQASLELAQGAARAAAKRVAAGRVSPVEEDRAALTLAASRIELAGARAALAAALHKLAAWWGDARPAPAPLAMPESDPDPLPAFEELARGLAASARLRQASLQVAREEAQVDVDRAQRLPDLTLIVGSKKEDEIGRAQTVIGLSVPLPVFNRNGGALQASLARADQARARHEAEQLRLQQELGAAYQRAQLAREQVRSMRDEILPAARRVFDATVTGFEAGKFGFLDVLDAQRTLLQVRTQYIETLHERYRALADLGRHTGAFETNRISP